MTKADERWSRHGFVRSAIKVDLIWFGAPALLVFFAGLVVSGRDGYDGLLSKIWGVILHPENFYLLSSWNIAGLVMFVIGLTIAIIAAFTLGRLYASTLVIREDHRLITHGLYRFMRHPIYFGVIIAVFGPPVYGPSLYGFLVMSLLIPIFLIRIRMEERLLTEEFGDAYREYQNSTSKLIPFIY